MPIREILDLLGGYRAVATALQMEPKRVKGWITRGAIPGQHWSSIILLARRQAKYRELSRLLNASNGAQRFGGDDRDAAA